MVSVVTYGRNDGHGYNLAKRAAISINCMAEVLDDSEDEIIFVDCNSEDDYATFPESIRDTLTSRARALLRIYRVRRSLYRERCQGSQLPVLESFSRNVALRRANSSNRWVLSTNPDMIFVLSFTGGLRSLLQDLPDGYYATPRYELPESLWESFDRSEPAGVMSELKEHSEDSRLHLAVRGDPWNGYDAPGDFQLMPLRHAVEIGGFHEGMVRGWHVDSNLARRFSLYYRRPALSLHDKVFAYHMMHLRMLTSGHTDKAIRGANSMATFIHQVDAFLPEDQPADWGAPDLEIEQVSLAGKRRPLWSLGQLAALGTLKNDGKLEFADYTGNAGLNRNFYASLERIQLFLANAFDHLPSGLRVWVWSGNEGFQEFMRRVAQAKEWQLSLVPYLRDKEAFEDTTANRTVPDICIFDFTLHFLGQERDAARSLPADVQFQTNLLSELRRLGTLVAAFKSHSMPTLYCLGVTHTGLEGDISGVTPNWDQIPFLVGFKRGRFGTSNWRSRLDAFKSWQFAKVRMAAEIRGHKTFWDRIALECLRFVGRFSTPS